MNLDEALRHALDGQAVLFLGAGFSADAKNRTGLPLPTGVNLVKTLAEALKLPTTPSLDIVSDMYKERIGESALARLMRDRFTAKQLTAHQVVFGQVPWRRIYTTNYDNVIELAHQDAKRPIKPITISTPPTEVPSNQSVCVHINGYIGDVTGTSLPTDFILTNTSYLSDIFDRSRWSRVFREDVEVASAVLFVGYSMYDIDIARALFAAERIRQKCCFVVRPNPSEETKFTLSRFGTIADVGADAAGARLVELIKTHVPASRPQVYKSFLLRDAASYTSKTVTDGAVFDLLVLGKIDLDLLASTFGTTPPAYYLLRRQWCGPTLRADAPYRSRHCE
jgi:SIR2-like domain